MLSTILTDLIENIEELCLFRKLPLSQPPSFAESWEEQGGPRTIRMRPRRGKGGGPNFYGFDATGTGLNQMVRKVWTELEVQCWGQPDPSGNLIKNTDDTENLRQIVVVAMNQTIPGGYRYVGEVWNNPGEVMMYGRCLTITFAVEQPIADIQPYYDEAKIEAISLTGEVTA